MPPFRHLFKPARLLPLALFIAAPPAQAEVVERRNSCEPWVFAPAHDTSGLPSGGEALLYCRRQDNSLWQVLAATCIGDSDQVQITYTPGYDFAAQSQKHAAKLTETFPPYVTASKPKADFWQDADSDSLTLAAKKPVDNDRLDDGTPDDANEWEDVAIPDPVGFIDPDKTYDDQAVLTYRFIGPKFRFLSSDLPGKTKWQVTIEDTKHKIWPYFKIKNWVDIEMKRSGIIERLPLRGSGDAISQLIKTCAKH